MSEAEPRNVSDRMLMRESSDDLANDTVGIVPFRASGSMPRRRWLSSEGGDEGQIPNRYEVRESEAGRYVRCKEAPGVGVSLDRSYAISEAEARKLGERVILIDGAGQFGPLLDNAKLLYNLDHHDECLRAFTLATCEQALVLVAKGLDLDKGDWKVYANEPDLDTLFAIWVLLNYRRLPELRPEAKDLLMPLIRLEGAIDANGYEVAEYCGLPRDLFESSKEILDRLLARELELKKSGEWARIELAEYAREMLYEIDKIVYKRSDFSDFTSVEQEYNHTEIGHDRVAVVCRDSSGIYDVEKRLKKVWGDRLGVIALEKGDGQYTLRRTASLAAIDLEHAYEKLNLIDPVVDGRPKEKRWGGSDEIGGSPRPDGTGLSPIEIAKVLRLSFRPPRPWKQLKNVLTVVLSSLGLLSAGVLGVLGWRLYQGQAAFEPRPAIAAAVELGIFALLVGIGGILLNRTFAGHRRWLFGWRWPAGEDWLALVPLVLAGGAAGAAWVPSEVAFDPEALAAAVVAVTLAAVSLEIWFRGFAHGLLILDSRVQMVGGDWLISRSTLVSGLLYAVLTTSVAPFWLAGSPLGLAPLERLGILAGGALVAGFALGMIRERSLSLLPCIVAQLAAALTLLLVGVWLGA